MAPMPMNSSSGNSSVAMPASNNVSMASVLTKGRFTKMAPKPMGSNSVGSISRLMAHQISTHPIRIIKPCCQVKLPMLPNSSTKSCNEVSSFICKIFLCLLFDLYSLTL